MKICCACHQEKPVALFNKRAASADGLQRRCRECERDYKANRVDAEVARRARWYQENKHKKNESSRSWYLQNKDSVAKRSAEWLRSNPVKSRQINARKKAIKLRATPSWADSDLVTGMYEAAELFRRVGIRMEVDHIVPLKGKTVSGLHTHDNLQLMVSKKNAAKNNLTWPQMP